MTDNDLRRFLTGLVLSNLERRGESRRELAERSGVSIQHVQQILSGHTNASVETWDKMLRAVGVYLGTKT